MNPNRIRTDIAEMNTRRDARQEARDAEATENKRNTIITTGAAVLAVTGIGLAAKFGAFNHSIELDTNIGTDPARSSEAPEPSATSGPQVDLEHNSVTFPSPEN